MTEQTLSILGFDTFLILGFYYSTLLADPSDIASFRPLSYSYNYDIK